MKAVLQFNNDTWPSKYFVFVFQSTNELIALEIHQHFNFNLVPLCKITAHIYML